MTDLATARTPGQREAPRPATHKGRDAYLDNAKFLALLLVVCGHTWGTVSGHSRALTTAYEFVYLFHMPVFIVVSGYLSRSFSGRPDQWKRLVTGVFAPYLIVQVLFTLWSNQLSGTHTPFWLLDPKYHLWFLPALLVWRVTTPLWKALRPPLGLGLALGGALVSGTYELGPTFDGARILQFLPFFVLGLYLRPEHFQRLQAFRACRPAAVVLFAATAALLYWRGRHLNLNWLLHNYDHHALYVSYWKWAAGSLGLTAVALVLGAAFLALVPTRHTWFTGMGSRSLCTYLLHPFVTVGGGLLGWWAHPFWWTAPGKVLITGIAFALATVLSTVVAQRVLRPVLEPNLSWMFTPAPKAPIG